MKAFILGSAAFAFGAFALCPAAPALPANADETAMATARSLAKQHSAAAAEAALVAVTHSTANSADWHVEIAQKLMWLAYDAPREGAGVDVVPALAASALQHLQQADQLTENAQKKAGIKVLTGLLQERYFGDHAAALTSYQAAAQLAPDHPQAKRFAARLQRMDAHAAEKLASKEVAP